MNAAGPTVVIPLGLGLEVTVGLPLYAASATLMPDATILALVSPSLRGMSKHPLRLTRMWIEWEGERYGCLSFGGGEFHKVPVWRGDATWLIAPRGPFDFLILGEGRPETRIPIDPPRLPDPW
jgi:hypothetical protein